MSKKTGINAALLRNQPPLTQVFQEFLNWIHQIIQQLEEERGLNSYHPGTQFIQCIVTKFELYSWTFAVIVAHNGYKFDFPLLLAEINWCSGLSTGSLVSSKWHFSDTLVYLRKVKKDGFEPMKSVTKFGLEALYEHFFPEEQYSGMSKRFALLHAHQIHIKHSTQGSCRCRGSRQTLHRHPLTRIAPTFTFKDCLQSTSSLDTSEEPAWSLFLPSQGTWEEDHLFSS